MDNEVYIHFGNLSGEIAYLVCIAIHMKMSMDHEFHKVYFCIYFMWKYLFHSIAIYYAFAPNKVGITSNTIQLPKYVIYNW